MANIFSELRRSTVLIIFLTVMAKSLQKKVQGGKGYRLPVCGVDSTLSPTVIKHWLRQLVAGWVYFGLRSQRSQSLMVRRHGGPSRRMGAPILSCRHKAGSRARIWALQVPRDILPPAWMHPTVSSTLNQIFRDQSLVQRRSSFVSPHRNLSTMAAKLWHQEWG